MNSSTDKSNNERKFFLNFVERKLINDIYFNYCHSFEKSIYLIHVRN